MGEKGNEGKRTNEDKGKLKRLARDRGPRLKRQLSSKGHGGHVGGRKINEVAFLTFRGISTLLFTNLNRRDTRLISGITFQSEDKGASLKRSA